MADGSISGTALNAVSGASLEGVTVVVSNTATGDTSTTTTDREGDFSFDALPDGTYNLTATKSGYVTYEKEKISPPLEDLGLVMIKKSMAE
ncbi:MAG TPA: carboxypeptidase-like regulatory domain-containing protein [Thermoanaerobaculia bacterium]|nr:carboxypeptidase-like regulatory domain-containing protein [Thermoanaerobaculia bacterium]